MRNKIRLLFNGREVKYIHMAYKSQEILEPIDYWVSQPHIEEINSDDCPVCWKDVNEIHVDTETRRNYVSIQYMKENHEIMDESLIPNHLVIDISAKQTFNRCEMKMISQDELEKHR